MKLLLVEDDRMIADGLVYSLEREGYELRCAGRVDEAKRLVDSESFALCLLDITLPDGDGHELCRYIKSRGATPVIFLTACDDESHTVMALEQGADDYVTKPFRLRELSARINAVLRRTGKSAGSGVITIGDIIINPATAQLSKNGEEITLTAAEYKLLLTLASARGQTLTRTRILDSLWDSAGDFVNDNTLTVYIKRLRRKLGDSDDTIIKTVRGIGYKID